MKDKPRAIGIDDGYFDREKDTKTKLVAVLLRADCRLEAVFSADIEIDGNEASETIVKMLLKEPNKLQQAKAIFLSGISFAGFNVVDIKYINSRLKKPVIVVFRHKPDKRDLLHALEKFENAADRKQRFLNAGPIHKSRHIYFQCAGINAEKANEIIEKFTVHAKIPEPVRIAHIIASGVTLGRSTNP